MPTTCSVSFINQAKDIYTCDDPLWSCFKLFAQHSFHSHFAPAMLSTHPWIYQPGQCQTLLCILPHHPPYSDPSCPSNPTRKPLSSSCSESCCKPSPLCTHLWFMQVQALPSGAITMTFSAKSDALAQDISAVVIHLYTQDPKQDLSTGKGPALAAVTEVTATNKFPLLPPPFLSCPFLSLPFFSFLVLSLPFSSTYLFYQPPLPPDLCANQGRALADY